MKRAMTNKKENDLYLNIIFNVLIFSQLIFANVSYPSYFIGLSIALVACYMRLTGSWFYHNKNTYEGIYERTQTLIISLFGYYGVLFA